MVGLFNGRGNGDSYGSSDLADESVCSKESTPLKGSRTSALEAARRRGSHNQRQRQRAKQRCTTFVAIVAAVLALLIGVGLFVSDTFRGWSDTFENHEESNAGPQEYDELGRFILEDYDAKPAFSDFLPGLAGIYGKPLYAFYINRGQGIASFGLQSKDYPILEYKPANKAYQNTALLGFRTFLQGSRGTDSFATEPFGTLTTRFPDVTSDYALSPKGLPAKFYLPKRRMFIGDNEMQLSELDSVHNIETNVTYFVLPEEDFGSFVRRTTITNTARKGDPLTLSLLDGLARLEPAGGGMDVYLKDMGKTLEGFMNVFSPYKNSYEMPFFRLTTQPSDSETVKAQQAGHYCLSMIEGESSSLLPIIYDPSQIFGDDTSLIRPVRLMSRTVADIIKGPQYGAAKTPSAFAAVDSITLKPGETVTITSFYGRAEHMLDVPVIGRRVLQPGFGTYKMSRAREIAKQITAQIETKTTNKLFNGHIKQMFLDSSLNGGVPTVLGDVDDDALMRNMDEDDRLKIFHLFSRIHGDLERDYNDFQINPTFFSEGPGHFGDLAQHRRSDVFFQPRVGSFNIRIFLSFLQADGYNPLTMESVAFTISNKITCEQIAATAVGPADGHRAQREELISILNGGPFRPGQLFELMEHGNVELIIPAQNFIDMVAAAAELHPMGKYDSGFRADHWTYYMDFIDAYLSVYPDHEETMLFDRPLKYFFSSISVQPRSKKYVLSTKYSGYGQHVRQLDATISDKDKVDYRHHYFLNTTGWYSLEASWQHNSNGEIFTSAPIVKLLLLATLKYTTRDAYGMGIEYEADKPGYDSALNGITGMIGSGMPEAYELYRLMTYLVDVFSRFHRSIIVPVELADLMGSIDDALSTLRLSEWEDDDEPKFQVPRARFRYWDGVATAREIYREKTRIVFSGETTKLHASSITTSLNSWLDDLQNGLDRAMLFGTRGDGDDGNYDITPTYFSYTVTSWKRTGERNWEGLPLVNATSMDVNLYPLFLEGPTRMMEIASTDVALNIYNRVRQSPLHDAGLGMYTFSASLKGESQDMGRATAFAPGWLENQSVWLQMSYKFYLQLLRNGMYDHFFDEMLSGGMLPFMDPHKYGRSLMECSTFIASSAFEDPTFRGMGFLARLSGATSEFLLMWIEMFLGGNPFFIDDESGELKMQLVPILPQWMFLPGPDIRGSTSNTLFLRFKLFGAIEVRYYNEKGGNLYKVPPYKYVVGYRDGSTFEVDGATVPVGLADKIRRVVFVASIDVYFQ